MDLHTTPDARRVRTFGWTDPAEAFSELGRRSGIDIMRAAAAGEIPREPSAQLLGLGEIEVTRAG